MTTRLVSEHVAIEDVADILLSLAALMETFHKSDVALQNALSNLASGVAPPSDISRLQHVDLLTQTHCDLARLLPILASSARGEPTRTQDLKGTLKLQSLQDALIGHARGAEEAEAGEVSFF